MTITDIKIFKLKSSAIFEAIDMGKWYFVIKIVLTYCEKNCSSDQENILKFEAEGQEFAKNLRSLTWLSLSYMTFEWKKMLIFSATYEQFF